MLHFCHITNLSGQLFPVSDLSRMARQRGITTIVDGAHAMAHFPYKLRDLEMDYYGVSLHKWLLAPTGTGLLYVRKERIASTWPLQAAPERRDNDIRKFEEIGTSPGGHEGGDQRGDRVPAGDRHRAQGRAAALPDAALGERVEEEPAHQAALQPRGRTDLGLGGRLDRRRRFEQARDAPLGQVPHRHRRPSGTRTRRTPSLSYRGLRVTPNIYTPLEEIDTFVEAMQNVVKNGLPA